MYISLGFTNQYSTLPDGSAGKEPACNAGDTGDMGSIPGQKDPLEKKLATCSSIPAWITRWTEQPGGLHRVTKTQTQLSTQAAKVEAKC